MCGRFGQIFTPEALGDDFGVPFPFDQPPRYNIAPSQAAWVLRVSPLSGRREWANLKWGLIPSWAKGPFGGFKAINARSETVHQKPAFRTAFRRRRALVPVIGFYEWDKTGGTKQPHFFRLTHGRMFALAGLWDRWEGPDGSEAVESFAILTTEANELVAPLHDRMPVILSREDHDAWLSAQIADPTSLSHLYRPYPAAGMERWPVGSYVNNPRDEGPLCAAPLSSMILP